MNNVITDIEKYKYYDRVYLCIGKKSRFKCKKFDSFKMADEFYKNNYLGLNRSVMIPICKYSPHIFDKSVLNHKLNKIFVNNIEII